MKRQHPSIQDVASQVGVSIMTVSRAMRGVEGVSAARRADILNAAKQLGYRPNRTARSLAASHSTLIGISLPTLYNEVFADVLDGMRHTFDNAGFDLVLDNSDYDSRREALWVERMLDWKPAAVILSGVDHAPEVRMQLRAAGIPTLEIWDHCADPIDICVGVDHFAAGYMLGEYLAACRYRSPAFVGVEEGRDPRAEKRLSGLRSALLDAGIGEIVVSRSERHASFESGMIGTRALLDAGGTVPDCICYLNDHMAFGGLSTCEKRGLSIPEDIGIIGFNGLGINTVLPRPLTTVITHRLLMGSLGARMLLARIKGARVERQVCVPVELSIGATTRTIERPQHSIRAAMERA
jgi:LacI family transcriptional regulator, gluconate utilization system Gnt-I transcriptional repressor